MGDRSRHLKINFRNGKGMDYGSHTVDCIICGSDLLSDQLAKCIKLPDTEHSSRTLCQPIMNTNRYP